MHHSTISAFILAGGKSRRFGDDKSIFMFRGRPLIEHVVEAIQQVIGHIAIVGDVSGKFAYLGLPSYEDIKAGIGPLGGLYTALQKAETDRIFVFPCDMPGLNTGLIRYMSALDIGSHDAIVPVIDGFYEPLHAVYSKSCLDPMESHIREGSRQIVRLLKKINIRVVTEKEISVYANPRTVFRNINFQDDLNDLQPNITGDTTMHDHRNYFNERAERFRSAGILSDEMVDFYRDLFAYLDTYQERYLNDPRLPALQPSELPIAGPGRKLFSLAVTGDLLAPGLAPIIEIIGSRNPGLDLKPLHRALTEEAGALGQVSDAVLDMDVERLEQFAISRKTGPDEAIFVIINWLKPFFSSLREKQNPLITDTDDSRFCPFCGNRPDMAAIVSGMDGKRYLHCSLCGHRWQYRRIACAVCGTEDADSLEYLSSEDEPRYRIDVCSACGGYIKSVRLDKFEDIDKCDLAVENILTAHLDSAAIQKGYKKP